MFFRKIIPMHQPTVLKRKPIIIVKKSVTPEGNPFKQTVTESGEKYIIDGKPSGFSISKGVSFVSGPNMKIKELPKKKRGSHLTLKNIVDDLMKQKHGKKLVIKKKKATKKPAAKKKVTKKPAAKKKVTKKPAAKKKVTKKPAAKKKVTKKPIVHKKGFAYKKHLDKKEYIVVSGKKKLIHKTNRGAEYYISKGKKVYIPSIKT